MANFCKQCSEYLFDEDYKELTHNRDNGSRQLCETCGVVLVAKDGTCIEAGCVAHEYDEVPTLTDDESLLKMIGPYTPAT